VNRTVGSRAHTEVAREVAERSLTLVRDASGLVPLRPSQRRVLVVSYADAADLLAGRAFARELARGGVAVESVRADPRTTPAEWRALRARAEAADVVVATASVTPREGRGSISADAAFTGWVEGLAASGEPTIAVSFGSPYLLAAFPSVPAYLLAWGGGEPSQTAAARALLGEIPITGTLPISLPPFARLGGGIRRGVTAAAPSPAGPR
jgi:beta-N-acetylhexosaminidase